ncbi:MAG: ABC transporter ATP-binding protein [Proteobacteria bacterium]|nr:ABC transporter ATP-binding protein [Pseudomonadota bacterium]
MTAANVARTPVFVSAAAAVPAEPHVQLIDISKRLGSLKAVDRVSLDVAQGSIVTLLGPSGCGKSTTLRLLAGLYKPDSGEILLRDQNVTHLPPNKRKMTMVFQEYALFPHLTIADNVGYGLRMQGVDRSQARGRVGEMLDLVGLASSSEKYPHQLSGGQQQRVALARAIAVNPEVLLLDEPLSNLDAKLRIKLREEIVRLQRVLGKTMVFVTHDQEEALSISDRVAVMGEGRIVQLGTPEDIYFRPANRYVAEFVGLANFIDVTVAASGRVQLGDQSFQFAGAAVAGSATLVVRPEAMKLVVQPGTFSGPLLRGKVERRSFLGSTARYWIQTAVGTCIVDEAAPDARGLSDDVQIALATDRLHLLQGK